MATTTKVKVEVGHRSSIPGARWCKPVDWEPANHIAAAKWVDGSWWGEHEEEAGLVCFAPGEEGDVIEVAVDDLAVATCGDCRPLGSVNL